MIGALPSRYSLPAIHICSTFCLYVGHACGCPSTADCFGCTRLLPNANETVHHKFSSAKHPTAARKSMNLDNAGLSSTLLTFVYVQETCQQSEPKDHLVACHELSSLWLSRLEFCDKETQQKWFRRHFELAASFQLPMFLHMRAAAPDFIAILKAHRSALSYNYQVPCRSGFLMCSSHPPCIACCLSSSANLHACRWWTCSQCHSVSQIVTLYASFSTWDERCT